jgi:hypothetical protein
MISPDDLSLFTVVGDVKEAADHICRFYENYHSQRYVDGKLVLRLKNGPSPELVEKLNDEFADIVVSGRIEIADPSPAEVKDDDHLDLPRLLLHFDRKHFARLRQMVDTLASAATETERR